jgi:ATP-dependent helicase/DNAse subunit B
MRLGSGLQQVAADDQKIIYLLPDSTLFFELKEQINHLNPLWLNKVEFMTFDQLLRKLLPADKHVIVGKNEALELLQILLTELNSNAELRYFSNFSNQVGAVERILDWILEMKAHQISPFELATLWAASGPKYLDLLRIYESYQEFFSANSLFDMWDRYVVAIRMIKETAILINVDKIIVEQCNDLMPVQIQLLNELADAGISVCINLLNSDQRPAIGRERNNLILRLRQAGFDIEEASIQTAVTRAPGLEHLAANIFKLQPDKVASEDCLRLVYTSGNRQEIEEIAARIKEHALVDQIALEEIAIVAQPIVEYQKLINEIFQEANIPFNISRRASLRDSLYYNLLLSIFKLKAGHQELWIDLIYSDYLSKNQASFQRRIKEIFLELGSPEMMATWNERLETQVKMCTSKNIDLNTVRRTMEQLYKLVERVPLSGAFRDYLDFIKSFERDYKIDQQISARALNNIENDSALFEQVSYSELHNVLNKFESRKELYDNSRILTITEWISFLNRLCEDSGFSYQSRRSEGVQLLRPNQIYGRSFRLVFVAGLLEGTFPQNIAEDWLLSENDKIQFNDAGFPLKLFGDHSSIEKMNFYETISAASKQLYLLCPKKDEEGPENLISSFLDEVKNLYLPETIINKTIELVDVIPKCCNDIATASQALQKKYAELYRNRSQSELAQSINSSFRTGEPTEVAELIQVNRGITSIIDKENNLVSSYDGYISNNEDLFKELDEKIWSATQLNKASQCRFAYFAEGILKLSSWEEPDGMINPLLRGNIFHSVLEKVMSAYNNPDVKQLTQAEIELNIHAIEKLVATEFARLYESECNYLEPLFIDLGLWQITKDITNILTHEKYGRERSTEYFYPKYLEYGFGQSLDNLLELKYPETTVKIRGKIDRIDASETDYYTIYDYKSGSKPTNTEIKSATDLQLYIYLLALIEQLEINQDKIAGAAYYGVGKPNAKNEVTNSRNVGLWKLEHKERLGLNINKTTGYEEQEWNDLLLAAKEQIKNLVIQLRSGDFAVVPTTSCPNYCQFKQICRVDKDRTRWKRYEGRKNQ